MQKIIPFLIMTMLLVTACARDLSSDVYTSNSTLSLTLQGKILSVRSITIKENDKLSGNSAGILGGAAAGAAVGSTAGGGSGKAVAIVGGALVGAAVGAVAESSLGEQQGLEYIVKVDTSKLKSDYYEGSGAMRKAISSATTSGLVTIVQGSDAPLNKGENVFVIFSDKRVRIISAE